MFALLKLPFKLMSLPLMIAFAGLSLLAKLCSNLSGYQLWGFHGRRRQSFRLYPQSADSVHFRMWCLYGNCSAMESSCDLGNHRIALRFSVVWLRPDGNRI